MCTVHESKKKFIIILTNRLIKIIPPLSLSLFLSHLWTSLSSSLSHSRLSLSQLQPPKPSIHPFCWPSLLTWSECLLVVGFSQLRSPKPSIHPFYLPSSPTWSECLLVVGFSQLRSPKPSIHRFCRPSSLT